MHISGYRYRLRDGVVIDKVYTSAISFRSQNTGPYTAELLNGQGVLLASVNFGDDRKFSPDECATGRFDDDKEPFYIILLFDERAQKLVIKKDAKIIWTRNRSINSPSFSVESPVNGDVVNDKIEIKISGYDKDGGNLHYILESCDNSQDITKVKDRLVDIRELCFNNRYSSGYEPAIRILCSDGFNTTESLIKVLVRNSLSIRATTSPKNVNSPIEVVFTKTRIDKDSINKESFLLLEADGERPVEGDISFNCLEYDCRLVFKPKNPLKLNTSYYAQVAAEIKDVAGNVLGDIYKRKWSFVVGEWNPVKGISPHRYRCTCRISYPGNF